MATPNRKGRRPLGSLVGNGLNSPCNNNISASSLDDGSCDSARKPSFDVLRARNSAARQSSSNNLVAVAAMNGNNTADIEVGDTVGVPGGMTGVVKFLGPVQGKTGVFAGVELSKEYASRGKNDGDVDGVRYFTTSIPGSGIFLPSHRASKQQSPTLSASTFPPTPTTPSYPNFDLSKKSANVKARTPPTPLVSKFNQSVGTGGRHPFSQTVGPGVRAPSPQLKSKGRPSLPRPESPSRNPPKLQSTPGRPSLRGARPPASPAPPPPAKTSTPAAARSTSRSQSRQRHLELSPDPDDTPTAPGRSSLAARSFSKTRASLGNDEVKLLQQKLDERDRQLKEQATSLADMESSLAELQSLMAANTASLNQAPPAATSEAGAESSDVSQLRSVLREKNDKIQMLTAEFDSHRADFRSTIDTLEMASTETERVYEKRVQELLQEVYELQSGREDVATVAAQLKQLEDLVQELEEGLEDARRGEAEARGEVEFLRGEIERARLELRREREKASKALAGADAAVGDREKALSPSSDTRDLEQRDDEIRGLKAIIHSLSSGPDIGSPASETKTNGSPFSANANIVNPDELHKLQASISTLQRERSELKGLIDRKNHREEELERENARLRGAASRNDSFGVAHQRTDSSSTATMHTANRHSNASASTTVRPGSTSYSGHTAPLNQSRMSRNSDSVAGFTGARPVSDKSNALAGGLEKASPLQEEIEGESDREATTASTEGSESASGDTDSLWCEMCEQGGHDVLTCSKMFGETIEKTLVGGNVDSDNGNTEDPDRTITEPKPKTKSLNGLTQGHYENTSLRDAKDKWDNVADIQDQDITPTSSVAAPAAVSTQPADGTAPGKSTGIVDMSKWCAMCEKDGHDSVDCPFEDY